MSNLITQVSDILTTGLSKGLISTSEADDALDTLHSFLQKYPTYEPKPARGKKAADPARDEKKIKVDVWTTDEVEMWEKVQPVLDKAQGSL